MPFVIKNPNAYTLAEISNEPNGGEAMTEAAFVAWRDAQLAAGWTPAALPVIESPAVLVCSPLEFIERLTDAEKVAIFTSVDAGVVVFRSMAQAAQEIRGDDPRTIDGLAYLQSLGLLTAERVTELLTP